MISSRWLTSLVVCMDGAAGKKGRRQEQINSVVFCHAPDDKEKKQLTSAVCHGFTETRAALASGIQPASRLIKHICKTFTSTEKLCYSFNPKDGSLVRSRTRCRCLTHPPGSKRSMNPTRFGGMLKPRSTATWLLLWFQGPDSINSF